MDLGYRAEPRFLSRQNELPLQDSLGRHANVLQSAVRPSGFLCLKGSLDRRLCRSSFGGVSPVFFPACSHSISSALWHGGSRDGIASRRLAVWLKLIKVLVSTPLTLVCCRVYGIPLLLASAAALTTSGVQRDSMLQAQAAPAACVEHVPLCP